jgi:nitroreductase
MERKTEVLMEKEISAAFEAPVIEVIRKRRSYRAYLDKPIESEKIESLFEAARWAPSSVNEQPWHYLYATKDQPDLWQRILNCLNEGNRIWAQHAPLLIVTMARKNFTRNDRPNTSAKYDLGGANALLSLQATALGLNVHQMGGYDKQKAIEDLSIPDLYELGVIMAIGYPGDPDILPDNLKQRELAQRIRYRQSAFVRNQIF